MKMAATNRTWLRGTIVTAFAVALWGCGAHEYLQRRATGKEVAPEPVAALPLPYAQMELRINGGLPGRMLLMQEVQGVQQWLVADGTSLWLKDGLVIATRGLADDVLRTETITESIRPDAVLGQKALTPSAIYVETASQPAGRVFEVARELRESQAVIALRGGVTLTLRQVDDIVEDPHSGERWQRRLWLTADGRMALSLQQLPGTNIELRLERIFPE